MEQMGRTGLASNLWPTSKSVVSDAKPEHARALSSNVFAQMPPTHQGRKNRRSPAPGGWHQTSSRPLVPAQSIPVPALPRKAPEKVKMKQQRLPFANGASRL